MKNTSKVFAFMTAFFIFITVFVIPVSAATVNYSCSNVSGTTGETVTVSVKISSSVNIWAANVMLGYNSGELQYVSSSLGDAASGGNLYNSGSSVNFAGMFSAKSGTVFTVKFKILKSSGSSVLTLTSSENIDYNDKTYDFSATNGTVTVSKPVTGITLDKSSVNLKKGETAQLSAIVTPGDATNKTVTYSTSDKSVATVSSSGKITAVGGGTATITAKAGDKTAKCKVSVTSVQTGITHSGEVSRTLEISDTLKLKINKVPADATDNYAVTWSSTNPEIASVSSDGTVTAKALGEATVIAKSNNWSVSYKITVIEKIAESTSDISGEETTAEISNTEVTETVPETTTSANEENFLSSLWAKINDTDNTVTKFYCYSMVFGTSLIVAIISIAVTFFATSGYYKNKFTKKQIVIKTAKTSEKTADDENTDNNA